MPRVNNIAITRQFSGGNFKTEKISVSLELGPEDESPGDILKELHGIVVDLDPYGPWTEDDVELATRVVAESREIDTLTPVTARQILIDTDAWRSRRNAAVARLNALGGVIENNPKPHA